MKTTEKTTELRSLTTEELSGKLFASKRQLFDLRMNAAAGKLEKPHHLRLVRREVARLLTLLKERGAEPVEAKVAVEKAPETKLKPARQKPAPKAKKG